MRRLAEVWIEGRERMVAMTKRRKPGALCQQDANGEEMSPPPKTMTQSAATDEELECRLRSALADVYEVLGYTSDERNAIEWSKIELVNDLIH